VTIEELKAERAKVVAEIQEVQTALGESARRAGAISAFAWKRQRADLAHRFQTLSERAGGLSREIKAWNITHHRAQDRTLQFKFYSAVADLEDHGIEIGDELRALMRDFEAMTEGAADG
jgi:predicted  nucleic acid-binding Zn-ribbon protein